MLEFWHSYPLPVVIALLGLVFAGGLVQGVLGFGLGVVSAPFVALLAPETLPGSLILASVPLPLLTLGAEWRALDWRALGWTMVGRLPATAAGVVILLAVPVAGLQAIVAASVLFVIALTLTRIEVPRVGASLAVAGAVSGITGTTAGIGGPPIAIVLRRDPPATARATMGGFFLVGSVLTLSALGGVGHLDGPALGAGLSMLPAAVLGFVLAVRLRPHVTGVRFRGGVLALSAVASVVLLVQALS